ncbi:MAG: shikimate kinase [Acidobacteriota bacterium]|nr:shikimate kinase [Blastocatellia bacterium]MDW8240602.1 shikimate kinase [Acidobacteriota bacterium]
MTLLASGSIFLVGFMGSGKTTVGRLLAERLGCRFIDLDEQIAQHAGKSIRQIFSEDGEAAFRLIESKLLNEIACQGRAVVSVGGGAFVSQANQETIHAHGVSVWLDCPFEIIVKRLEGTRDRPLYQSREQLRALWESRQSSYAQAMIHVQTHDVSPHAVVEVIMRRLRQRLDG